MVNKYIFLFYKLSLIGILFMIMNISLYKNIFDILTFYLKNYEKLTDPLPVPEDFLTCTALIIFG